jgi:hypothetical protein
VSRASQQRRVWLRRSQLDGAVYGTEFVTFSPSRRGIVPLPIERLEELLFEAGYTPAPSDEERQVEPI